MPKQMKNIMFIMHIHFNLVLHYKQILGFSILLNSFVTSSIYICVIGKDSVVSVVWLDCKLIF